jgi:predicted ATP-dependent protease
MRRSARTAPLREPGEETASDPARGRPPATSPLPVSELRWRCDPRRLPFRTTEDVEVAGVAPEQKRAWEALRFAVRCDVPDQNVYVRGVIDSPRRVLVLDALPKLRPAPRTQPDLVYIRNAAAPHRPRLVAMKSGAAARFARSMRRLAEFVRSSRAFRGGSRDRRARRDEARRLLEHRVGRIRRSHPEPQIHAYLEEVVEELLTTRFGRLRSQSEDPLKLYAVNVLVGHVPGRHERPIVVEDDPTPARLLGTLAGDGDSGVDEHARIRAGAFIEASGGYLVLEAGRVLALSGSWHAVVSTLRSGAVDVHLPDRAQAGLRPDPIPVRVRVILIGDRHEYGELEDRGPDFAHHFKVLADLDSDIDRDDEGFLAYGVAIARLARDEGLLAFDRTAVSALIEHGARISGRGGKITGRIGRIADVAREAEFLARERRRPRVTSLHVQRAVVRTKQRGALDARRFLEYVQEGAILIHVEGAVVGQVNGLSVIHAGPLTYGFPCRITASVGAGSEGILDIESRSDLSGSIHTKGFQIFQGLLRRLLETDHPLAFTASLASEQTYGRVDGDSSSAAQLCCLISALARVPIRQCLAATGAVDQLGRVQSVGAVDEKIEGFFDVCSLLGLDGTQGVVIPRSNAADLMLRQDVVDACSKGRFHVYGVDTIYELLTILTGHRATPPQPDGTYPADSLLALAVAGSRELWEETARKPS